MPDGDSLTSLARGPLDLPRSVGSARFEAAGACLALQGVICRLCLESCPESAIRLVPLCGGYSRPAVIAERCNGCGACLAACPGGALSLTGVPA